MVYKKFVSLNFYQNKFNDNAPVIFFWNCSTNQFKRKRSMSGYQIQQVMSNLRRQEAIARERALMQGLTNNMVGDFEF
jgi:hypothetical protein